MSAIAQIRTKSAPRRTRYLVQNFFTRNGNRIGSQRSIEIARRSQADEHIAADWINERKRQRALASLEFVCKLIGERPRPI